MFVKKWLLEYQKVNKTYLPTYLWDGSDSSDSCDSCDSSVSSDSSDSSGSSDSSDSSDSINSSENSDNRGKKKSFFKKLFSQYFLSQLSSPDGDLLPAPLLPVPQDQGPRAPQRHQALEAGGWRMEDSCCRLETGDWRL